MALIDCHIHLPEYGDPEGPIRLARARSMCLISCTVNATQAPENLRMRSENPQNVRCFVGVHPSDVTSSPPSIGLAPFFSECDGIGEIGLDEKYSATSEGSAQMEAFLDQLRVAEELGKPVQVHSRGSERACLDVLGTFNLKAVLMHWFEGEALISEAASRGYYFSLGPALLYSKKLRRMAPAIPADRLITESDGPVSYGPLRGADGPNLIASVLFRLGEIRGERYEDLEPMVEKNARRYLNLDPAGGTRG